MLKGGPGCVRVRPPCRRWRAVPPTHRPALAPRAPRWKGHRDESPLDFPKNTDVAPCRSPGSLSTRSRSTWKGCAQTISSLRRPKAALSATPTFRKRVFDRAAASVGLRGLRPHDLRHTAASLAVAAGANVKAVQQMLGPCLRSIDARRVRRLFEDDLDDLADRLHDATTTPRVA